MSFYLYDVGLRALGVIGVAELLMKTALTEEQREYLNIIRLSGDNLLRIISDILDLSKIETHKLVLERAQFGVRELLTESLSLLQVIAQEKGIKVRNQPLRRRPLLCMNVRSVSVGIGNNIWDTIGHKTEHLFGS